MAKLLIDACHFSNRVPGKLKGEYIAVNQETPVDQFEVTLHNHG